MPRRFVQAVARGLEALGPPPRLLVAVSGGADSVALLQALSEATGRRALSQTSLFVGHVDHRLRPDSHRDAGLVEALARRLCVPFGLETIDLTDRTNLEEQAREARYAALVRMAANHGCEAVVTAHTATDQAETLLWRLARGAGARGLSAMATQRPLGPVRLLRPMLGLTREQTRSFCRESDLPFIDDPTNLDDRPRARLRAEVLPVLERLVPGGVRHVAEAAARLRADDALLESLVPPLGARPSLEELRSLPAPLRGRALARWAAAFTGSRRRLGAVHLDLLDRLVQTGRGEVELPAKDGTRCVGLAREGRLVFDERPRERPFTRRTPERD
ncbi:MAG: tRNA(Ile)-lysidine synthase [Pseudomonadota bacterium]|jgi:tRNA(Ile)-lysidine synthase